MKKAPRSKQRAPREGLRRSYRFDYSKAKPNRFVRALSKDTVMVVLDPDVAAVFRTSRSVNAALRAAMSGRPANKRRLPRAG